ncbi:MAG: hypothetical protein WC775_06245 [Patescibacteria group bacterium]
MADKIQKSRQNGRTRAITAQQCHSNPENQQIAATFGKKSENAGKHTRQCKFRDKPPPNPLFFPKTPKLATTSRGDSQPYQPRKKTRQNGKSLRKTRIGNPPAIPNSPTQKPQRGKFTAKQIR